MFHVCVQRGALITFLHLIVQHGLTGEVRNIFNIPKLVLSICHFNLVNFCGGIFFFFFNFSSIWRLKNVAFNFLFWLRMNISIPYAVCGMTDSFGGEKTLSQFPGAMSDNLMNFLIQRLTTTSCSGCPHVQRWKSKQDLNFTQLYDVYKHVQHYKFFPGDSVPHHCHI